MEKEEKIKELEGLLYAVLFLFQKLRDVRTVDEHAECYRLRLHTGLAIKRALNMPEYPIE